MGRRERPTRSEVAGGGDRPPVALRYPRLLLGAAAVLIAFLVVAGFGVEGRLKPASLAIPGTGSYEANEIVRDNFGDSAPFVILLRGPAPSVDRQGPELIRILRRNPQVTTLSPWDRGSLNPLRPSPRKALILADFHVSVDEAVRETVPYLERTLEEDIHPPVRATQTGFATLSKAIQEESIEASERGELIALPILLIVLLLVFRSPIAALVPLVFGAITVFSSRGILYFLTGWLDIDAFALTVCTMMGLALGVDYSLLMVSRFREELRAGTDPVRAAWTTRRTAGRTTMFAGSTLVLSMIVSLFIVPGSLLTSLAGTLIVVTLLSVLVATLLGPALLILLNDRIDLWRVGNEPGASTGLMALVNTALRRPAPVAALIGAVVLFLAAPALALKTGPPDTEQLPADNPARIDAELIDGQIGPGFDAPFTIVADVAKGTITQPGRLGPISRWQRRLAAQPGVQAVIGPGQLSQRVAPLRVLGESLLAPDSRAIRDLRRLGRQLGRAAGGVTELRGGIAEAAYGALLLGSGAGDAQDGATTLSQGLGRAGTGAGQAVQALDAFATGSRQLFNALRRLQLGTLRLKLGLRDLAPNLRNNALNPATDLERKLQQEVDDLPTLEDAAQEAADQLAVALDRLDAMTVGKTDPEYEAALEAAQAADAAVTGTNPADGSPYAEGYDGLPAELAALRERLAEDVDQIDGIVAWLRTGQNAVRRLGDLATRVHSGTIEITSGAHRLANGAQRLSAAASGLDSGLEALNSGARRLATGIGDLQGGAEELAAGLSDGFQETQPLESGLRSATTQVISQSRTLSRNVRRFNRATPRFFDSGYFVLTAVDGSQPPDREASSRVVDLDRGGQAAAIQVISRYSFNSDGSIRLDNRLDDYADGIARDTGARTGVAGGAATLNDYTRVTRERIPWVVGAITIATFLILVLVLRSIPLAALAVGLNLLTVAVAFGVLTLLFEVPEGWPLGGRSYVDAIGAVMIFGVVFGLSIDYAVFLLMRMREHYDEHRDNAAAINFGLEKTARVITGAAAIMMGVFIAFAGAPVATVSQLGIGLTIAVLLDATVVRIVLLPALMLLAGDRIWWLPRWLDRAMPRLDVHGVETPSESAVEHA